MSGDAGLAGGREVRPVVRPSVPPLAWLTVGVWLGVLVAEELAWRLFGGELGGWVPVAAVMVNSLAAVGSLRGRAHVLALLLVGSVAGQVVAGAFWLGWRTEVGDASGGRGEQVLTTATDATEGRFGASVGGTLTDEEGTRRLMLVRFSDGVKPPELCEAMSVLGSAKPARPDERGRMLHRDGRVGTYTVRRQRTASWPAGVRGVIGRIRRWSVLRVEAVPGAAGALLSGVLLGDRRRLQGTAAEADFRSTGLTHLVAVSGSHLVVVGALVAWLCSRLRASRVVMTTATLGVMSAYVVATGMQSSAMRALVMTALSVGALYGGRRTDRAAALAGAAAIALVAWPPVAYDLGFALSIASVAGLIFFARYVGAWLQSALPGPARALGEPVGLTVVAQAATFPITAPAFGAVSLVAPLANLFAGPLIALMLVVGLCGLGVSALDRAAGQVVLKCAGAMASLCIWIASRLAAMPHSSLPIAGGGLVAATVILSGAALLWATWPAPSRDWSRIAVGTAGLCLAVIVAGPRAPAGSFVAVLDVGQGDAILIRDGPNAALVDTGPEPAALREALARNGVRDLEFVALTHAHDDHTGGVSALRDGHRVDAVVLPSSVEADSSDRFAAELCAPMIQARTGQTIRVGDTSVTVLWPRQPVHDRGENAASLVLLVKRGNRSVLLTGDAETDVLEPLGRAGMLSDVDVLKVGHHGSRVSLSPAVLAQLRPEEAVISVGEGNRFGHPTAEALDMLAQAGCSVRRTDLEGDVVIPLGRAR